MKLKFLSLSNKALVKLALLDSSLMYCETLSNKAIVVLSVLVVLKSSALLLEMRLKIASSFGVNRYR
ncbi:hypothetical protein HPHPH42_0488 [Helicobacter pylori Hp H-42]|uniref:Uncharacterized protein n=1 Tax=Helicobacter pylori Hp H-42 TaxID=992047 RepID=A0AB33XIJ7_HELPX|nr:hypothetical protein HPHPH42_0488 [Helicobacter pylori Hp H-42]